jgi:hypothetical protein
VTVNKMSVPSGAAMKAGRCCVAAGCGDDMRFPGCSRQRCGVRSRLVPRLAFGKRHPVGTDGFAAQNVPG